MKIYIAYEVCAGNPTGRHETKLTPFTQSDMNHLEFIPKSGWWNTMEVNLPDIVAKPL